MSKSVKTKTPRSRKSNVVRDIPLKRICADIHNANKSATITTKAMRTVLRREFAQSMSHARNASWVFSQSEYDAVRSRFDPTYRAKVERATKRASKKAPANATPNADANA